MTKLGTLESLSLERAGKAYELKLMIQGDEAVSAHITADLLHEFVKAAQHALGEDAPTGLDLDDGTTDPWIEGP